MEPLAVPPASQPLARVDKFVYMWSSHGAAEGCGVGPPYATAGAGGVDVIGSDKGVTVWRPQPPMGYALLGDVLAAGTSPWGVAPASKQGTYKYRRAHCGAGACTATPVKQGQLVVGSHVSNFDPMSRAVAELSLLLFAAGPAGHSQPDHQVVAVAISSGLVTYPLGFTRVWESPGACSMDCACHKQHLRHRP